MSIDHWHDARENFGFLTLPKLKLFIIAIYQHSLNSTVVGIQYDRD